MNDSRKYGTMIASTASVDSTRAEAAWKNDGGLRSSGMSSGMRGSLRGSVEMKGSGLTNGYDEHHAEQMEEVKQAVVSHVVGLGADPKQLDYSVSGPVTAADITILLQEGRMASIREKLDLERGVKELSDNNLKAIKYLRGLKRESLEKLDYLKLRTDEKMRSLQSKLSSVMAKVTVAQAVVKESMRAQVHQREMGVNSPGSQNRLKTGNGLKADTARLWGPSAIPQFSTSSTLPVNTRHTFSSEIPTSEIPTESSAWPAINASIKQPTRSSFHDTAAARASPLSTSPRAHLHHSPDSSPRIGPLYSARRGESPLRNQLADLKYGSQQASSHSEAANQSHAAAQGAVSGFTADLQDVKRGKWGYQGASKADAQPASPRTYLYESKAGAASPASPASPQERAGHLQADPTFQPISPSQDSTKSRPPLSKPLPSPRKQTGTDAKSDLGLLLVRARSGGLQVKEITPGTAAHRSGQIQVGDYLLAVQGEGVTGMAMDQVAKLVQGAIETITLEFNRLNAGNPRTSSKFQVILALSSNLSTPSRSSASLATQGKSVYTRDLHDYSSQPKPSPPESSPTKSSEGQGSLLSGLILPPSSPRDAFESANVGLQNLFRHSRDASPASGRNSRSESPSVLDFFAL